VDPRTEIITKGVLSLLALLAIVWRHRPASRLRPEQAGQLLWLVALVAGLAYFNFGHFHGRSAIHHWEQFHYYLGSKYFPELRYDGLYVASLAAEEEIGLRQNPQTHTRDLRNNEVVRTTLLEGHQREVRQRFSDSRWRDFTDDVEHFLRSNNYRYITRIRLDHGYNPTPTWTFTARLFSRWLPARDGGLALVAWLDPLLLAALFFAIFKTFGSRVGCLSLIVFGLGYGWRYDWVGGAMLRQDWLAAIGIAICLLDRKRYLLAGALIAYASMVRVFPAAFLVGAAVLWCVALVQGKDRTWARRIAAGFALGIILCLLAGSLVGAGPSAWSEFRSNLEKHHDTWLTNNVGLKNTVLYDRSTMRRDLVDFSLPEPWIHWQARMNVLEDERRPAILLATALFLALVVLAARRQTLSQASVLGIVVIFSAVVLTCYYWVMLLLIPVGRGRWLPTTGWLALNTGLFALHLVTPSFEMIYGVMSWALAVFFVAWMAPDTFASLKELRATISTPSDGDQRGQNR
jgi:hypothetical protein